MFAEDFGYDNGTLVLIPIPLELIWLLLIVRPLMDELSESELKHKLESIF